VSDGVDGTGDLGVIDCVFGSLERSGTELSALRVPPPGSSSSSSSSSLSFGDDSDVALAA
jgi:hypothetical protein